ncbi:MAG TPA: L-threonylcarbamoyladenylate synthase [Candidatus Paceibacterota bacterium]|nr:L-threonylcarbamoyladenylate synthase [Candidatus Paceibacterota bacterium]
MELIRLSDISLNEAAAKAAAVLRDGGIVLFPTDTLYGLAVDIANPDAVERLRQLKSRERRKPFSVIVPDVEHIEKHAELHSDARALAETHLPGALTLVLPAKRHISPDVTLNGTIGIRVPNDAFSLALAQVFGKPYSATSANETRLTTPATAHGVIEHFKLKAHLISLVVDAGARAGGVPSTVVTFIDGRPYVTREGAISREDLGL